MQDLLPSMPLLLAFLAASLVLALTPGPAVFYIVTRSISQGRAAGLASVAGVALGNLGNALGAAVGLAALFAVSDWAFAIVKYCGAAYLIYLGIRAWRSKPEASPIEAPRVAPRRVFADGAVVALLNPKTALFFAAFLPQFIDPLANALEQTATLGAVFVMVAGSTDVLYALLASSIGPRLARGPGVARFGRYLGAGAYFGLGAFAALGSIGRVRH
jgi:threonine/homoserine/homoserine lactone efflux protein